MDSIKLIYRKDGYERILYYSDIIDALNKISDDKLAEFILVKNIPVETISGDGFMFKLDKDYNYN